MCLQALTLEHSTSFPPQAPGMVADIIYYVAVFAQGLIRQTKFRAMAAAIKRSTTLQSFELYAHSVGDDTGRAFFSRLWKLKQLSMKKPVVEITFEPDLAVAAVELP